MVNTTMRFVETRNIVQIAESRGDLKNFVKAVNLIGLGPELSGSRAFTVFAPTDAAFYTLDARSVQELFEDRKRLSDVVTYHLLPDKKVLTNDVTSPETAMTMQGNTVLLSNLRGLLVNNVRVIQPDIKCANGVIHVIDALLTLE